jgi:hypothetical protein
MVSHGFAWTDAPSTTVGLLQARAGDHPIHRQDVDDVHWLHSSGVFNTQKAAHVVDPTTPQERRPKVEEFVYLDLPAPKLALALQTGGDLLHLAGEPARRLKAISRPIRMRMGSQTAGLPSMAATAPECKRQLAAGWIVPIRRQGATAGDYFGHQREQ